MGRPVISSWFVLTALVAAPRPCLATEAQPGPLALSLTFVFSAIDEAERDMRLEVVKVFNDGPGKAAGIVVEGIPRLWAGYDVHDSYVRLLALQDPSVDLILADVPWIPEFAEPGWLLPLEGRLPHEFLAPFEPVAVAGGRYGGGLYGLPVSMQGNLLLYRKDLLAARGLAPTTSISELDRQARLLRREEGLPVGLAIHALYLHNDVFPFLWASGGGVLGEDGTDLLTLPASIAALDAVVRLFRGDPATVPVPMNLFSGPWRTDYRSPLFSFRRGEAAFAISWSPDLTDLESAGSAVAGRIGVAPIPGTDSSRPGAAHLGSWYVTVNASTRHPDAAVLFARHMVSVQAQKIRWRHRREVPSRRDLDPDPAPELRKMLAGAGLRPRFPNERERDGFVERWLHKAVRGEVSPTAALEGA